MSGITTLIIIAAVMACTLGGVSLLAYPVNTDDVKRLFGLKTKDDLFIENVKW